MSAGRRLQEAVGFLTPVRVFRAGNGTRGRAEPPAPAGGMAPSPAALWWFPAVGGAIGSVVGGVWWLADRWWPPAVAAVIAVGADLALTGMLHFDGLADSADGLLPPLDRLRRLEVMADPRTGAWGVTVVFMALLARWASLSSLAPSVLLLAGLWALSRTLMAVAALVLPYARPEGGLVSAFVQGAGRPSVMPLAIGGLAGALGLSLLWRTGAGGAAVGAALVGGAAVLGVARRRLGGVTGDVLGAAGVAAETLGLLVAAAKW